MTLPPEAVNPISALTGTPFFPVTGVTFSGPPGAGAAGAAADSGEPDGTAEGGPEATQAACAGPPTSSRQPASTKGATTSNDTIAGSERRIPIILSPVLAFRGHILP
ncbi:hypothetical protein GCM10010166_54620 [Couchioplanes caeruleus subsp. azureus]|nr:hypothetical protein GCM10010166_54620 [Couchioplanes caeruleus subsp. azureus]